LAVDMGYLARYMREHYVSRRIRRDIYERFIEWCGESSINSCLEKALSILAANTTANITANIAVNTEPSTKTSSMGVGDPSTAKPQADSSKSSSTKPKGSKPRKVVRWLWRGKVRDLDAYFKSVEESEGRRIAWVDKSDKWVCWAYRDEVEEVVRRLNEERVPLNAIHEHPEGRELYECGVITFEGGEWRIAKGV